MGDQPFCFLDLPKEIGLMIYERLPRTDTRITPTLQHSYADIPESRIIVISRSTPTSIPTTCRQIHDETKDIDPIPRKSEDYGEYTVDEADSENYYYKARGNNREDSEAAFSDSNISNNLIRRAGEINFWSTLIAQQKNLLSIALSELSQRTCQRSSPSLIGRLIAGLSDDSTAGQRKHRLSRSGEPL
ncbi:hypothetical protein K469DRAFT_693202 [Zopfia rhizophila CBS 207.26]|uniref:Uncharacterized protein n=1 Tax=Zopfia rhizophila CBS 207.26 TaxID=1314779 RepID=A0A6A6EPS6_9PEZI|nr:hypothetical protein K469DRAFT_693202 [Zopfia rhizophila CBS 207.26]